MNKLTKDQLSTVIYALEGYCQGNDDDQLVQEIEQIIDTLTRT
tara:strand:- start:257 stop:385 length:129 start_codon:yes stop_codon:yes gene_type:complete